MIHLILFIAILPVALLFLILFKKRGFCVNFLPGWAIQMLFSLPACIWQVYSPCDIKKNKDWFVICMLRLFLVNSLTNTRWFWAGN